MFGKPPGSALAPEHVVKDTQAVVEGEVKRDFAYDDTPVPKPPGTFVPDVGCRQRLFGLCCVDATLAAAVNAAWNLHVCLGRCALGRDKFPLLVSISVAGMALDAGILGEEPPWLQWQLLTDTIGLGSTQLMARMCTDPGDDPHPCFKLHVAVHGILELAAPRFFQQIVDGMLRSAASTRDVNIAFFDSLDVQVFKTGVDECANYLRVRALSELHTFALPLKYKLGRFKKPTVEPVLIKLPFGLCVEEPDEKDKSPAHMVPGESSGSELGFEDARSDSNSSVASSLSAEAPEPEPAPLVVEAASSSAAVAAPVPKIFQRGVRGWSVVLTARNVCKCVACENRITVGCIRWHVFQPASNFARYCHSEPDCLIRASIGFEADSVIFLKRLYDDDDLHPAAQAQCAMALTAFEHAGHS
jgi:hypothetical protein